jgi:hypothetical protein
MKSDKNFPDRGIEPRAAALCNHAMRLKGGNVSRYTNRETLYVVLFQSQLAEISSTIGKVLWWQIVQACKGVDTS